VSQGYPSRFTEGWLQNRGRDASHADRGAAMAEFALLLPFLLALTVGIIEMSNVFYVRSVLNEMVRDTTRRVAIGALDETGAKTLVLQKVAEAIDSKGDVQVTESTIEGDNTDVTIVLSVPLRDLFLFDNLSGGLMALGESSKDLTMTATMLKY